MTGVCQGVKGYIGWVWANGIDLSKVGSVVSGSSGGLGTLQSTIQVPAGLGKTCTFEKGDRSWSKSALQGASFWVPSSPLFVDSNGFYRWGSETGAYVIAMTPKFGETGGIVNVHFNNGAVLSAVLGDEKGSDADSEWGHSGGTSMAEFIVKSDHLAGSSGVTWYGNIGGAASWLSSWWKQNGYDSGVASVDIMGRLF